MYGVIQICLVYFQLTPPKQSTTLRTHYNITAPLLSAPLRSSYAIVQQLVQVCASAAHLNILASPAGLLGVCMAHDSALFHVKHLVGTLRQPRDASPIAWRNLSLQPRSELALSLPEGLKAIFASNDIYGLSGDKARHGSILGDSLKPALSPSAALRACPERS
jgi:hypothetical protein